MNYVESLNLFGVEAKEIPCILGSGAPTTATKGAVGCFYMDTSSQTKDVYKCTYVRNGVYTWVNIRSGGNASFDNISARGVQADRVDAEQVDSQRIDVKDLFVIGADGKTGAALSPEGYEDGYAVLTLYGIEGDEYTRLRYVAPGKWDCDAATVGQLNSAVGNIETALDSILSIQEQLIGGADE